MTDTKTNDKAYDQPIKFGEMVYNELAVSIIRKLDESLDGLVPAERKEDVIAASVTTVFRALRVIKKHGMSLDTLVDHVTKVLKETEHLQ